MVKRFWSDADELPEVTEAEILEATLTDYLPAFDGPDQLDSEEEGLGGNGLGLDLQELYGRDLGRYPTLDKDEEREFFKRYRESRDLELRNRLICHNLRFVSFFANKYRNRGVDFSDLVQQGSVALVEAVEKYDIARGVMFSSYAGELIKGEMLNLIGDTARTIRRPVYLVTQIERLRYAKKVLLGTTGQASDEEISSQSGSPLLETRKLLAIDRATRCVSFEELASPSNQKDGLSRVTSLHIEVRFEREHVLFEIEWIKFKSAQLLSPRNFQAYLSYYGLDDGSCERRTLEEVGSRVGLTRERVRQILVRVELRLHLSPCRMESLIEQLIILSEIGDMSEYTPRV